MAGVCVCVESCCSSHDMMKTGEYRLAYNSEPKVCMSDLDVS